jgi:hypothetical protein
MRNAMSDTQQLETLRLYKQALSQHLMRSLTILGLAMLFGGGLLSTFVAVSPAQVAHAATLSVTDCTQYNGANTLGAALAAYGAGDT